MKHQNAEKLFRKIAAINFAFIVRKTVIENIVFFQIFRLLVKIRFRSLFYFLSNKFPV